MDVSSFLLCICLSVSDRVYVCLSTSIYSNINWQYNVRDIILMYFHRYAWCISTYFILIIDFCRKQILRVENTADVITTHISRSAARTMSTIEVPVSLDAHHYMEW